MTKLKTGVEVVEKKGLHYVVEGGNGLRRFKPWLGDSFSFLYDLIMSKSVFPRKLGSDIEKHHTILAEALSDVREKQVLELATGSGSAVHFLHRENRYTGTDISPGLLKRAAKRFREGGFPEPEFYVVSADDLPFADGIFDVCLCILSLNFFSDAEKALREARRVLAREGAFVCSVPVPERNKLESTIRGALYSEAELERICRGCGLGFEPIRCENGALLYFVAIRQD